jgi:tetratricopeptide (TPR) repeat protein
MPSLKTIWDYLKKHPIWGAIVIVAIFIWLISLIFIPFFSLNSVDNRIDYLTLWVSLLSLGVYAWTLWVLIDTFRLQQVANQLQSDSAKETAKLQKKAIESQSKSAERTARMEMAKVLTESFSHSEMFEAIDYFLQVSPYLTDGQGDDNPTYIKEINVKPETKKYRYRILTTLRHAQRLYDKEKPDTDLFTSLITPDIVEVTLCLHKLNDYIKDFNEPVYKMVYKVFEDIRTSYLEPYWDALDNKKQIAPEGLEQTRRILKALQAWDRQWGDEGDRILTKKDLILLDLVEASFSSEAYAESASTLNGLIERFEVYKKEARQLKKRKVFAELYFYRGIVKYTEEKYIEAIEDYTKAIDLDPQNAPTYNNRGIAKYKDVECTEEKYIEAIIEAIVDYSEAIKLNPQYADAYYNRAEAYQAIGKQPEADKDFAEYIRLRDSKQ